MAVYVDNAQIRFGRMHMSHMMADTSGELLAMANRLGLQLRWLQHASTHKEHFDISKGKRTLALEYGAVAVTSRELGLLIRRRRLETKT